MIQPKPKPSNLKQLVNETLERLCAKYPLDDHQSIMRASFEIFAVQLLSSEYCDAKEVELYNKIKNGVALLEKRKNDH